MFHLETTIHSPFPIMYINCVSDDGDDGDYDVSCEKCLVICVRCSNVLHCVINNLCIRVEGFVHCVINNLCIRVERFVHCVVGFVYRVVCCMHVWWLFTMLLVLSTMSNACVVGFVQRVVHCIHVVHSRVCSGFCTLCSAFCYSV